jgi:hypothetical protein
VPKPKRAPHAFVILVVLAALAVITAVIASQLVSGQKAQVIGLRVSEEVRARSIAQACLEMMSAYANNIEPDAGPGTDLDRLLAGPDGIAGPSPGSGDDYLPFGNVRQVAIPPGSASQLHQWNLVDIPGSGGLCAVRFDDNSDDARPALPGAGQTGFDGDDPDEGTGKNVPNKDRDLAVYLTVIGMYPVLPGTADPQVYARAHTRVTLRRLIQNVNIFQPLAPALWAGNLIDLKNNNDICGAGGVQANNIQMDNNSCACGEIIAGTTSGAGAPPPGDTCSCPSICAPANLPGTTPSAPPTNVHWADLTLASSQVLGAPLRAFPTEEPPIGQGATPDPGVNYTLADARFCALFADSTVTPERLYVWDVKDTDAVATLTALGATGLPAGPVSCAAHTGPVPAPCTWDPASGAIACGLQESPCWKLIAIMDTATAGVDVSIAPGAQLLPLASWNNAASDTEWHPRQGPLAPLPNVAGGRHFGIGPNQLCGDTVSRNCNGCQAVNAPGFVGNVGGAFAGIEQTGAQRHWHFDAGSQDNLGPSPSVWFVRANLAATAPHLHIRRAGAAGVGPLRASFVTNGSVRVERPSAICCATCDCSPVGATVSTSGCDLTSTFGATPAGFVKPTFDANPGLFNYSVPPPPLTNNIGQAGGYAIKAGGTVTLASNLVIGDVRGTLVNVDDGCVIGSVAGYDPPLNGQRACSGSAPCGEPSVCVDTDARIIGDVHSMADADFPGNNARLYGNIAAKGSVCFKNNAEIEGTIMVNNTIEMKNNATVVNTSASQLGSPQAANNKIITFMEATW